MTRGKSRRHLQHGRPSQRQKKTPRYLIVTNGVVTEASYFRMRNIQLGNRVSLKVKSKKLDPEKLAQYAKALIEYENNSSEGGDVFERTFVVTDVDLFTLNQFVAAQKICNKNGFQLVITNPCFEVWLIDHLEVCGCREKEEAKGRARSLGLVRGDNNKELNPSLLSDKLNKAISNARKHNTQERRKERDLLRSLDFAPWTDMADFENMFG